ncbi:eukaryotic translation initiation factor 3 subunit G-like [Dorcoceras hygrometricum]|uniref:Eukaryotic translation initiation factor 3 subunit G-like n=1 Tax=Dorcoceras hygrometricum TaxID=472368 RepID=A0A2Z6ZTZ9_9LAMI|nr:eukaryotic translation initiation factor 3 subunit G-like [Dorcoceras hygrometricum]
MAAPHLHRRARDACALAAHGARRGSVLAALDHAMRTLLAARFSHTGRRRKSSCVAAGRTMRRARCAVGARRWRPFGLRLRDDLERRPTRCAPQQAHDAATMAGRGERDGATGRAIGRAMMRAAVRGYCATVRFCWWRPPAGRRSGEFPTMS